VPDCAPGRPCPDHSSDGRLITSCRQRHHADYLQVCAALDLDPAAADLGEGPSCGTWTAASWPGTPPTCPTARPPHRVLRSLGTEISGRAHAP
jgi:hypothetical protein